MSFDYSDEETDRLLAAVDVADIESPPAPSPEILGVVQETPIDKVTTSDQGMAPLNGSEGELRRGEDPCQGPTPVTLGQARSDAVRIHEELSLVTQSPHQRALLQQSSNLRNVDLEPSAHVCFCLTHGWHTYVSHVVVTPVAEGRFYS